MGDNIYMYIKSDKGAALVTTLIALIVLSILVPVFIFSMTTEGKQSIQHDNKSHAYYMARSGAEAVLEILINEYEKDNLGTFIDQSPTIYGDLEVGGLKIDLNNGNHDEESIVVGVSATYKDNDLDVIKITSTGQKVGQKRDVTVELFAPEFTFSNLQVYNGTVDIPTEEECKTFKSASDNDLGWTAGDSGRIFPGTEDSYISGDGKINFHGPSVGSVDRSLKLNQGSVNLTANEMYFTSHCTIHSGATMNLTANKFIFYKTVEIQGGGKLCLHAKDGDAIFQFRADLEYDNNTILDDNTYLIPAGEKVCFPLGDTTGPSVSDWPQKWE